MNSSTTRLDESEAAAGVILKLPTAPTISSPEPGEYLEYFHKYIALVPGGQCGQELVDQIDIIRDLFAEMDDATARTVHAPYTWSLNQVLGHLVDCERVFGYRAARIASGDATVLSGFDENSFVLAMRYAEARADVLYREWLALRIANLTMFSRLTPVHWAQRGSVAGNVLTARATACIIAGHTTHHTEIVVRRLESA